MNAVEEIQFDLFETETLSALKSDVAAQKESLRKIQKKLFGQHNDMVKMLLELLARIEQLEGKRDETRL
jgi:hypothetical protein